MYEYACALHLTWQYLLFGDSIATKLVVALPRFEDHLELLVSPRHFLTSSTYQGAYLRQNRSAYLENYHQFFGG
jgi:hypothetical protein